MSLIKQKIFKEKFVNDLRARVRTGKDLEEYLFNEFSIPEEAVWETNIIVDDEKLDLSIPESGNQATADLENAIKIYEAYKDINETQASDPRLWTYLTHITFGEYTLARWGFEGKSDDEEESKQSDRDYILSHWFVNNNDRSLRRNAISRLWWAAYLTKSPWERNPSFFEGSRVETTDPYKYTKILFSTQDVFQQVLERSLGRDSRILIPILDYIDKHSPLTRAQIRELVKQLNLVLSVRNVAMLNFDEMRAVLEEIGDSFQKQ